MGQVLHGSATTTEAVRRAIQHSQESLRALAKRHGVNPKTIAKWKARKSVSDLRTGPKEPRSTVLSAEEEAVVVNAFRRHALLPLDDCLLCLAAHPPASDPLVASPVSATPRDLPVAPGRRQEACAKTQISSAYPIGYFHIDIAEVRTGARQALPHRRHRPNVEVRLRRDARRRWRAALQGISCAARPPPSLTRSIPSSPTTELISPPQAIRVRRRPTSRAPSRLENLFGRTPSNTPAPRTTSIIG